MATFIDQYTHHFGATAAVSSNSLSRLPLLLPDEKGFAGRTALQVEMHNPVWHSQHLAEPSS